MAVAVSLFGVLRAAAAPTPNPAPAQVLYLPFREDSLLTALQTIRVPGSGVGTGTVFAFASISVVANGTYIYYDQWENGFDADISNPTNLYSGANLGGTQIWGDGNTANGAPPFVTTNAGDVLTAGQVILLNNRTTSAGAPGGIPIPRVQANIFFDGGDKIATNKSVAVTKVGWGAADGTLVAGGVEVYDTSYWGTDYRVPVGVNIDPLIAPADFNMFEYTGLWVMAGPGGATVSVDLNGDGDYVDANELNGVSVLEGRQAFVNGNVNVGSHVVSNNPVQVHFLTGDIGETETRDSALLPTTKWSTKYYSPVSTVASDATTVWFYNPTASAITVTWTSRVIGSASTTTGTVSVPGGTAGTLGNYNKLVLPVNTGWSFSSTTPFSAFSTTDSNDGVTNGQTAFDWGFTLIPDSQLTPQVQVGLGIGRDPTSGTNPNENGNPVWITPVGNGNTAVTVYVDYDGDPATGSLTDPNGSKYDISYSLRELEQQKIYDPDRNQTGMLVYVVAPGVTLAAAWGQDPLKNGDLGASAGAPGLDVGTSLLPVQLFQPGKNATLSIDSDGDGFIGPGDEVLYTITVSNIGRVPVPSVVVSDVLPADTTYVPNSTLKGVTPIPDSGATAFPLDEGGYNAGSIPVGGAVTVTYKLVIDTFANLTPGTTSIVNIASATALTITRETPPNVQVLYGSIGDFVWIDTNHDGIQNGGEIGLAGATVNLLDGSGAFVATTTTGAGGIYVFNGVPAGSYIVEFVAPTHYQFATQDQGGNDLLDSDANTTTGRTAAFSLLGGQDTSTVDAGLWLKQADLTITKDDGVALYSPGGTVTYTVTVTNAPLTPPAIGVAVPGALVTDNKPANILSWTWACTSSTGGASGCTPAASGAANFTDTVDLPVGGSIVYTVTAIVVTSPTGDLVNTATVAVPSGYTDTASGNNSATDTDARQSADLVVTKSNGALSVNAGGPTTYTITLTNNGPSPANGATLSDPAAAGLTKTAIGGCTSSGGATCPTAGTGAGEMNIANLEAGTVVVPTLPSGGSISFTVTATVTALNGSVTNTTTATPPAGTTDPTPATASDTDTVATADLSITKTSAPNPFEPGLGFTYTITVSNNGPSNVFGASVVDTIPAGLTAVTWTSSTTGTASVISGGSGSGHSLAATVDITAGAGNSVTFTVTGTAPSSGTLINTATVTPPDGTPDPVPGNNTAGDTNPVGPKADLSITKTSSPNPYVPGSSLAYTITVSNSGPSNVVGASVADTIPAGLTGVTWTSSTTGTASVTSGGSGSGNSLAATVDITAGAGNSVTFTVAGTAPSGGTLNNTATVTAPAGTTDPTPGNNSAQDTATAAVGVIDAVDDAGTSVNGVAGGTSFTNVLANDKLNGVAVVPAEVTTTFVSSTHAGVTLVGTDVVVEAGTAAGSYTLTYKICEIANPSNCDEAVVTAPVSAAAIDAVNDTGASVNGVTGGTSFTNVLANDKLNGVAVVPAQVTTTFVSSTNAGVTLVGTDVVVEAGTAAGSYELVYQICEIVNPSNCDTATVTVPVSAAAIDAVDDAGTSVNGYAGGTSFTNVLVDDKLNGVDVVPAQVTTTFVSSTNAGVTLSGTNVVVAAGTPAGSYTLDYKICEILNPSNCDTATVTVPVSAAAIDAVNDAGASVNGLVGGTSFTNVLVNDKLNGVAVVPEQVTTTFVSSTNAGVTLSGTNVVVAAGTPAGSYTLDYKICEILNPSNCDTATVTVPVSAAAIDAVADSGTAVNGVTGGTSFTNVLANDLLNGVAVVPAQVTTTFVSSTDPGVTLVGTDVVVAAGTPAGSYTLDYKICEILNPSNCDTVTVTVPVGAIDAFDDAGTAVNGVTGGISFTNVLVNDTLNGVAATAATVTTTQISTTNAGVTLVGTGVVVAAATPAGNYTLVYQICEIAHPTVCDTASVTVPVGAIDAVVDTGTAVNGVTGGTSVPNVLVNDTLNGVAATTATVTLTQVSTDNAGVTLDTGTGAVNVAAGTAAGNYTLVYKICEVLNPTVCDTASVTVPVGRIDAVNDTGASVNGYTGGTSVPNVLVNDTLNGFAATTATVTLTQVSSTSSGVSLDTATGAVNVASGTAAGNYTLVYQICDPAKPTVCDTATVTVRVRAADINAVNDSGASVNGFVGGTSFTNVLGNDTLNGVAVVPAEVMTTFDFSTNPGVTLSGTDVVVAAGTPAGSYALGYQICEILNPLNCDTASVTVTVRAADINAVNDIGTAVNGVTGGTSFTNVLVNDTLNGVAVDPAKVTMTLEFSTNPGVTLSGTNVVVAPGTPSGSYALSYKICEILNPTNCDQATVTVPVTVIDAVNDTGASVNGFVGGTSVANVLVNDKLNGATATLATVNLTVVTPASDPGVTLNPATGAVSVAAGTPAGSYTLVYQICDQANPTICDTASVTVPVAAPVIDAINDAGAAVNGVTGGTSFTNVLGNDLLNGVAVVPAEVTTTFVSSTNAGVTLSGTNVVVAAGTPAGSYSLVYKICENLNPTNCDSATVTVPVTVIDAVNDTGASVNGFVGGTSVANVLVNDKLNGAAATLATVNLTQVSTDNAGVTLNPATGAVSVAAGTAAGSYTVVYQICEKLNPAICDTATVTVPVTAPVIDAVNNAGTAVNGVTGGTSFTNVLANDKLNGVAVDPAKVTTTFVSSTNAGVTLSGTNVMVAAGTPAGSYSLVYKICENLNPTNCDTATVTVPVTVIDAVNDTGGSVNGFAGGTSVANVLVNDKLNGVAATLATVNLTQVSTDNPGVTLNPATGAVSVAAGTAAGSYELVYKICDKANPTICDTATVTVPVTAPVIDAVNDAGASVNGFVGGTSFTNVLVNDKLNGVAVVAAKVTTTFVSSTNAGVTLSGTNVVVAAGTPAGSYTLDYKICEILNPTNCDTATVTVPVTAPVIDAVNDTGASVNGFVGGTSVPNVLVNDKLNGVAATLATVNLTQVSTDNPGVTLNPATGAVSVAAGTAAGSYSLVYKICEIVNPLNCDTATVTVSVTGIDAVNDTGASVNGFVGGTSVPNVLVNDKLNGVAATLATVNLTQVSTDNPGVTLNPATGAVSVAAATPAGSYTLVYKICEKLYPLNCDTATVTVPVTVPTLFITKSASAQTVAPYVPVIYTYTVTNTGVTTLTNIVVTDDNGTPEFAGDDFTVGTIASLDPGASTSLTHTVIPVVSTVGVVNGVTVPAGLVVTTLPSGDIKVTYLQNFGINDNTYGTGAIGWPATRIHAFGDLTGSDKLEFRFFDTTGKVAIDFYVDTITAATSTVAGTGSPFVRSYPAGYGTLGPFGGDGIWIAGTKAHLLSYTTSITDNLNNSLNVPKKATLIVNSPTSLVAGNVVVNTTAAPGGWDYINSFTVVIDKAAFGAAGFGGVAVPDQHNSPNKLLGPNGMATTPVSSTVVNTATATAGTLTATATASVNIVVPPPTANNDTYAGTEDMAAKTYTTVLANDTWTGGTAVLNTGVSHGTLTFNADGTFIYKPAANYNGPDLFTYKATNGAQVGNVATVTINVAAVNDAPVAVANTYNVTKNTLLTVTAPGVLGNDTDVDGLGMTAVLATNVTKGTLVLNANGSFTYTPPANTTGTFSFTYKAKSTAGLLSSAVTVSLVVK